MYQILGHRHFLTAVGALAVIAFAVWGVAAPPSDAWGWIRAGWGSASMTVAAVIILGEYTPAVPWLAGRRPVNRLLPDLDGDWLCRLTTNWPAIAEAHGLPVEGGAPVMAEVRTTVRLFRIRMQFTSAMKYSESNTVAVHVLKSKESGDVILHYIYRNETPIAKDTDSGMHYGAASLMLKSESGRLSHLEGHYWTNRN